MDGVSLVICCHNSSKKLEETLKHVSRQKFSSEVPWELIIVDNASTDLTSEMATAITQGATYNCRIVTEGKVGLKNARLKGIVESKYDLISFIDDDNWICESWIENVHNIMSNRPEIGACGGIGLPKFETSPPDWFELQQGSYAVGLQAESTGYIPDSRGYLWGAGLTIRRSAMDEIIQNGFCFSLTGRHGASISSGEDTELCLALRCLGWRLWYDESLSYYHYLPSSRLSWSYLKRLQFSFGASSVVLNAYNECLLYNPETIQNHKKLWIADSMALTKSFFARDGHLFSFICAKEGSSDALFGYYRLGRLLQIISLRHKYDELKNSIFAFWQRASSIRTYRTGSG
ncbi:glycosyltransferase [Geotalea daltonii FRC-32]|uniref:Glycosyltransferase n=1 Tax=Geotalea daltonii (strain DSM 22248 / JCM 15807 / FRC-32) TaxID=316067 RepID=B9M556_GEODF|nr:glycosyltransferase [Geotalea daltonii]ACM19811.1 glycosyltransferase [Geotalea daltonii FRC-32]